jgi:hypothetical protein
VKPEVKQHDYAVYTAAGAVRVALGQKYSARHKRFAGDLKNPESYKFLWVTDFPMFEWDEEGKRWAAAHHPFTSPHEQDMAKLEADPGSVRANAYDIVLNGTELGSGSIRIHRQDIQRQIFRALGMTEEEAKSRFGFFLEALEYGTPPHGGIALGLDRIVMIIAGGESLREVIPFPKTARAVDLMVDAPTPVSEAQLRELGIRVARRANADPVVMMQHYGIELCEALETVLTQQSQQVHRNLYSPVADEVTNGLLSRNFRLLQSMVTDYQFWSDDLGKVVLRMMLESLIYMKYLVSENSEEQFMAFQQYGIGQERLFKLQLRKLWEEGRIEKTEDLKSFIESDSDEEISDEVTKIRIDNFENLRELAERTGLKDEYLLYYQPFSVIVHGHWPALTRYYLQRCTEPLHRLHFIPNFEVPRFSLGLLPRALLFFSDTYDVWTSRYGLEDKITSVLDSYGEKARELLEREAAGARDSVSRSTGH